VTTTATTTAAGRPPADDGDALAEWWRRLLGFVIDALVLTILTGALWGRLIASFVNRLSRAESTISSHAPDARGAIDRVYTHTLPPYLIVLGFTIIVAVVYYWLLTGYWGTTIGKRSVRTWVVRAADGTPPGLRISFGRALVFVGGGEMVPFFFPADSLWLLGDERRQCLHDKAAGTIVVKARPGRPPGSAGPAS